MADINTHLLSSIDGVEYEIETIGDECVVRNFSDPWENMCRMLFTSAHGPDNEFCQRFRKFLEPSKPLFSFPASPELKAAVIMANEWFDQHEEASKELCDRIQQLAEPEIRRLLSSAVATHNPSPP